MRWNARLEQGLDVLAEAGPEIRRRLYLKITAAAAITPMADANAFIDQVRALGVRIALDDFGAGASSFDFQKNLSLDLLRIDGKFIRDRIDDPLDDAALRCFVDVARVVAVRTVTEFVYPGRGAGQGARDRRRLRPRLFAMAPRTDRSRAGWPSGPRLRGQPASRWRPRSNVAGGAQPSAWF